jgi:hypothetical protein
MRVRRLVRRVRRGGSFTEQQRLQTLVVDEVELLDRPQTDRRETVRDWTRTFDRNARTPAATITGRWIVRASNDRSISQTERPTLPGEMA